MSHIDESKQEAFIAAVHKHGRELYRELPWRNTTDPYEVLVSEVMLQQTQVVRVLRYWQRWLERFPTVDALAAASTDVVLESWQGLGYNRRALALKKVAECCSEHYSGTLPQDKDALLALPGIGPSTAAGVRVFSYGLPDMYLETNVRTVYLNEFFADEFDVPDSAVIPLVEQTCDMRDPRAWYYALLDWGAYLKKTLPNPSRRSKHHSVQSAFEGSRRQKRAWLLREVMAAGSISTDALCAALSSAEGAAGRTAPPEAEIRDILGDLQAEKFLNLDGERWCICP